METLTTGLVRRVFEEEVAAAGGRVKDVFDDGRRLFMRSVLPSVKEVRPRDHMQSGVALKFAGQVVVSPYVFREVCKNGAIWAHSLESTRIAVDSYYARRSADAALDSIREAVRGCCTVEAFEGALEEMRRALTIPADRAIMLMPALSQMAAQGNHRIVSEIIDAYLAEGERTGFGLMNAVTAVAREVDDPELKWELEECGAGIPALLTARFLRESSAVRRVEEDLSARFHPAEDTFVLESETRELAAVA